MVDIAALRSNLRDPIDLGTDSQCIERDNDIIAEGISSVKDLVDLYRDIGIKTLYSNVRKLAGTIPGPRWVALDSNLDARVAPYIPTPGHQIPAICELPQNFCKG